MCVCVCVCVCRWLCNKWALGVCPSVVIDVHMYMRHHYSDTIATHTKHTRECKRVHVSPHVGTHGTQPAHWHMHPCGGEDCARVV